MAVAKTVLGLYLSTVPTYSAIYGTFATLPILLIWIYTCWVIFLLGAVVAAYVPSLLAGTSRDLRQPGWKLELALETVAVLEPLRAQAQRGGAGCRQDQAQAQRGLPAMTLAKRLHVDRLQLEPALSALTAIRWVGAMPDTGTAYLEEGEPRYVLLADPDATKLEVLIEHMLLTHTPSTDALWHSAGWGQTLLRDALPPIEKDTAEVGANPPAASR